VNSIFPELAVELRGSIGSDDPNPPAFGVLSNGTVTVRSQVLLNRSVVDSGAPAV